jgi:hypothetical protein
MKKFLLSFLCFLLAVTGGYAEEYSYTFTSKQFSANGTKTLNGVEWTLSGDGGYWGIDGTKGQQFGSGSKPYKTMTLSTSDIEGTITKIVINTSGASDIKGTFKIKVGNTEIGTKTLTKTATSYTFDDVNASGEILLSYTQTSSKAIYIKSIVVIYTKQGSNQISDPVINITGEGTSNNPYIATISTDSGTTPRFTLDGNTPTNASTKYDSPITIKANATLKVVAFDDADDTNFSAMVQHEFEVEGGVQKATLVEDAATLEVGNQVVIVASDDNYALSTTQKGNNRAQAEVVKSGNDVMLNEKVQILTLENGTKGNTWAFRTKLGYLYAASSSDNYLRTRETNDDNGSWTISIDNGVASIKANGDNTRNLLKYNSNSSLFSCYASGQDDVSIYKVSFEDYTLKVTEKEWATLFLGCRVEIPNDVACYIISDIADGKVQLQRVTGILPANTAVIVNASEGEHVFKVTGDDFYDIESIMKGTPINKYVSEEAYVLADGADGVALYRVEMNGGVFLNNANKAYLPASLVSQAQNTKALKFNFDTTGVEGVKVETEGKKVIYDLSGRRMNEMTQPGVYIVNGKKMMVK